MFGGRSMNTRDTDPLLKKKPALFSPNHRLRMNILPMFLNIFLPWGVFVYCFAMSSFYMMYSKPAVAWAAISIAFALWAFFALVAFCARRYSPDPTWFTFFSILYLICAIWGVLSGLDNLNRYERPYYTILEMREVVGVNPSTMSGEDVMDAGVIGFQEGTSFDADKTWHFKKGTTYCVAPIIGPGVTTPLRQTYDFWAIGTDCCSVGASDFRCGSWGSASAHAGLREVDESNLKFYRLAVQQAESMYDIMAPHPIFLEWTTDASATSGALSSTGKITNTKVNSWHDMGFKNFLFFSATNLIFDIFCVLLASARFAWLGRSNSAYDMQILDDVPNQNLPTDMSAKMYAAA
eukprot:gb/GFBE01035491.1/.p1 GENE.gb/GFBE01035491.1/~~gb/GFBE01035491.1/.p1  ORF type:complete len:350 (+),score=76.16 gb/GFBE01035491.1/:1-1050(+)